MAELTASLAKGAAEKLAVRLDESDVARDITIATSVLKQGQPLMFPTSSPPAGIRSRREELTHRPNETS
jgi:hypothetical protein